MDNPNILYLAINLPWSTERREHMAQQAAEHGIDIQIIEAVAGATLTDEQKAMYDSRKRESMYVRHLTPNEQACVHSHRKALQTFLASSADYGVVLEDDSTLEKGFVQGLMYLIKEIPGWECCKLYTEPSKLYPLCPPIPNAPVQPVMPKKIPWGSVAYIYSRSAAEKIMARFNSFWLGADTQLVEMMFAAKVALIGITPNLVGTLYAHNEQSDIDADVKRTNTPAHYQKRSAWQYLKYRASVVKRAIGKWRARVRMQRIFSKTFAK